MAILDAALHVAQEVTYGTAVTPTRSFEAKADTFKRAQSPLESVGFRAGMETVRSDRRKQVNMGGVASTELDVLTGGMGMLFEGLLGTVSGPTQVAATTAYEQTHSSQADDAGQAYTLQMVRPHTDGTTPQAFTHAGCKPTGWKLSVATDGLLTLSIDWDFQNVVTATATATAVYPASTSVFTWEDCTVQVDAATVYASSFEFSAELGLSTERQRLQGSALKREPMRAAVPSYTCSMELDYDDESRYDEWVAGSVHAVTLHAVGPADGIESGYENELLLTLPAVQWDGESPEVSLSDNPKQALTGKALDNGTDAAVSVYIQSTDSAL